MANRYIIQTACTVRDFELSFIETQLCQLLQNCTEINIYTCKGKELQQKRLKLHEYEEGSDRGGRFSVLVILFNLILAGDTNTNWRLRVCHNSTK